MRSELKRWVKQWETEVEKRKKRKAEVISKSEHFGIDWKASYSVKDPPDSFFGSLEFAGIDSYPIIRQLLIIGCV